MDKAMALFWDVGYEEASLADLLQAMEITKGSFYKAFHDKQSVYLAALDRYNAHVISGTVDFLTDAASGTGRERILGLFDKVVEAVRVDGDRLGCFLCNALIDRAAGGGEAERKLQAMTHRLEGGFRRALLDDGSRTCRRKSDCKRTAVRLFRPACFGKGRIVERDGGGLHSSGGTIVGPGLRSSRLRQSASSG